MPSALDSYTNSIYNHDLKILFPLFGGAGVGKTVVKQWFPTDIAVIPFHLDSDDGTRCMYDC